MQRLLVLGGGTAGTMVVNKLRRKLDPADWQITDRRPGRQAPVPARVPVHPVRRLPPADVVRSRHRFIPDGVELVLGEIDRVDADASEVHPGRRPAARLRLPGHRHRHDAAAGPDARHARPAVADVHLRLLQPRRRDRAGQAPCASSTAAGSSCTSPTCRSSARSRRWSSPSSPRPYFRRRGMRDRVEITYATPLPGAFTKPICSEQLGWMLDERKIAIETDFMVERIDDEQEGAGLLRRAGDPVRPARDGAAEHGRRLHRPLRARRRAELRAGGQAHAAVQGARQHLRRSATRATSRPRRPARWRTSRSTSSPATSASTSRASR